MLAGDKILDVSPASVPEMSLGGAGVSGRTAREGSVVADDGNLARQRYVFADQDFAVPKRRYAGLATRMVWNIQRSIAGGMSRATETVPR